MRAQCLLSLLAIATAAEIWDSAKAEEENATGAPPSISFPHATDASATSDDSPKPPDSMKADWEKAMAAHLSTLLSVALSPTQSTIHADSQPTGAPPSTTTSFPSASFYPTTVSTTTPLNSLRGKADTRAKKSKLIKLMFVPSTRTPPKSRRSGPWEYDYELEDVTPTTPLPRPTPTTLHYDSYAAAVEARKFFDEREKSTAPPTQAPSTTMLSEEDSWRVRQEKRIQAIFKGNPHFTSRYEDVKKRRLARHEAEKQRYYAQYGRPRSPSFRDTFEMHHKLELTEQEKKEIEEEWEVIDENFEWEKEYAALNSRFEAAMAMKEHWKNGISVVIDPNDQASFFDQLHMAPRPAPIVSEKKLSRAILHRPPAPV